MFNGQFKILAILTLLVFFVFFSKLYSQDCTILSKANDITPDGLCAPVSLSWEVTYTGVNNAGTLVEFQFDWDDGNAVEIVNANETSPGVFTYTISHTYPEDGPQCNYNPNVMLIVDGTICSSSLQEQNVTVWDVDDSNGGHLMIDPVQYRICVGNDGTVTFVDASLWNCVPPEETDVPNGYGRWTQWIYGTNNGAGNFIGNVEVDGVVQAYPYWGAVDFYPAVVYGPFAPNGISLPCYSPNTALVGQQFEVTIRNWNYCNPYDDPAIPGPPADLVNGDNPPIETTAMIVIVDIPDATIDPAGPFCANDPSVTLNAATSGGTWSGTGITNPSNGTFDPSAAGVGTHVITYSVTDGNGCTGTDTETFIVYPNPSASISADISLQVCPGSTIQLDGNPSGGTLPYSNVWFGNVTPLSSTSVFDPEFYTTTEGDYMLTYMVEDANGCRDNDNVTVSVYNVEANPLPLDLCEGATETLIGNPSGGTGNYVTHLWTGDVTYLDDTGVENPQFVDPIIGSYDLSYTVTDDIGCTGTANVTVQVFNNPFSNAGPDDSICGPDYSMSASASLGMGSWSQASGPGSSTFGLQASPSSSVNVDAYGVYEYVWTEVYGPGCTDRDTVEVIFTEQPVADAGAMDGVCGYEYPLNANPSVGTGFWQQTGGAGSVIFADSLSDLCDVTVSDYGLYEFTWTEDNGYGCVDNDQVTVSFNVQPEAVFSPDTSGCPPLTVPFVNESTGGSTFQWYFDDGGVSNQFEPDQTFYNSLTTDRTYNVKLIVGNGGCSDSTIHTVTVYPLPDANFLQSAIPGCSPVTGDFSNVSTGAVDYFWDFGDGSPVDSVENTSHIFVNDTTYIQFYTVTLTAITDHGCRDSVYDYVQVYPLPEADFIADPDSSCQPAVVHCSASPFAQTYLWDFGDGAYDYSSGSNTVHTFQNLGTEDTTYTVELVVVSPLSCSDTSYKDIVVHPKPDADFVSDEYFGCTPLDINLSNSSNTGDHYLWNFGDGEADTTFDESTVVNHTFTNSVSTPVTYSIELIAETDYNCRDTLTRDITIYPEVVADFTVDTAGCNPFPVMFTNQSIGAGSYIWDFNDGGISSSMHPVHVFQNNSDTVAEFDIELVAVSGFSCHDTVQKTIEVYPKPKAIIDIPSDNGCSPYTAELLNLSTGTDSCLWLFGDGTVTISCDSSITHLYQNNLSSPAYFEVQYISINDYGCSDSLSQILTVYPDVEAAFTSDTIGCSPFTISTINQSFGAAYYQWDFGDGSNSSQINPQHNYQNIIDTDTVYNLQLIATSIYMCQDSVSQQITVLPKPEAQFSVMPESGCSPLEITINNGSQGADYYQWQYGNGEVSSTSASDFTYVYENNSGTPDVNTLKLEVSNIAGCQDSVETTIVVYPDVNASFICDTSGCSPLNVSFLNQSTGASTYQWNFGDASNSMIVHPTHMFTNDSYASDTVFEVQLIAVSDYLCNDTVSLGINVYPSPVVNFIVKEQAGCSPLMAEFDNNSVGADEYYWSYGDSQPGNLGDSISYHLYENQLSSPVNYSIQLQGTNQYGCSDNANEQITIYPEVEAGFMHDTSGCSVFEVNFHNQSYGAQFFTWNFGDNGTSQDINPSHDFANYTTNDVEYNIEMIASSIYSCSDTAYSSLVVYPSPIASFSVSPLSQTYPSTIVDIDNLSSAGNWNYSWDFGNGTFSDEQNPVSVDYQQWGDYEITLEVYSQHCSDATSLMVEIIPAEPTASFGSSASGCAPFTMKFTNNTQYATSYLWTFGDGFTSTHEEPIHTFYDPGIYNVSLQAIGPGGEDYTQDATIEVFEVPEAYFSVGPKVVYLPDQPIHCYNLSEGADFWKWDFGDENTSDDFSPMHLYTEEGLYDIWLWVWTDEGCRDSVLVEKAVDVRKSGDLVFPNAFTPDPSGSNDGSYEAGDYTNNVFYPANKGIEEYHLQIFNRWGELIFESFDINIGWNGYYRDELCKQDVYVWKVKGKYINGQTFIKAGDVTLVR